MALIRSEIMPGVFLNSLQSEKFKSDCLSVSLLTQLDRKTVSKNALIPRVLARGSVHHPDMAAIAAACDDLYGARLIPCVRKRGEVLAVGFYAGFISERFTPGGEKLLESVVSLLGEVLLSPATRGGLLQKDFVESEKHKLIDDIRARVNDKRSYATDRLIEEMCALEDYGSDEMGSAEDAAAVGYVDLTRHYRELLRTSPVEIFYCGGAGHDRVAAALSDALITLPRGEIDGEIGTDIRMNALTARPREFEEVMDVTQGKLCLGFRLGKCMEDPDFAAIRVFSALYGGSATSKLFMNVRERLSLCYYASSACDVTKGVMVVSSGIEPGDLEPARNEILAQLKAVAEGDFTADELRAAKKAVAGALRSVTDSVGALEDFYLTQTVNGLDYGPEEMAALCEGVGANDVVAVASGVELDSVYFLHGPAGGEDDEGEEAPDNDQD